MALSTKIVRGFGVLEYWKKAKPLRLNFNKSFHYSITPPLHYSICLECQGKTPEDPPGGRSKPAPLGLDSNK
jgi:hypothetical protein